MGMANAFEQYFTSLKGKKITDEGSQERTAYEISALSAEYLPEEG